MIYGDVMMISYPHGKVSEICGSHGIYGVQQHGYL